MIVETRDVGNADVRDADVGDVDVGDVGDVDTAAAMTAAAAEDVDLIDVDAAAGVGGHVDFAGRQRNPGDDWPDADIDHRRRHVDEAHHGRREDRLHENGLLDHHGRRGLDDEARTRDPRPAAVDDYRAAIMRGAEAPRRLVDPCPIEAFAVFPATVLERDPIRVRREPDATIGWILLPLPGGNDGFDAGNVGVDVVRDRRHRRFLLHAPGIDRCLDRGLHGRRRLIDHHRRGLPAGHGDTGILAKYIGGALKHRDLWRGAVGRHVDPIAAGSVDLDRAAGREDFVNLALVHRPQGEAHGALGQVHDGVLVVQRIDVQLGQALQAHEGTSDLDRSPRALIAIKRIAGSDWLVDYRLIPLGLVGGVVGDRPLHEGDPTDAARRIGGRLRLVASGRRCLLGGDEGR
jgi:hypothetical protein